MKENFKMLEEAEMETCIGDVIGTMVKEENVREKIIKMNRVTRKMGKRECGRL